MFDDWVFQYLPKIFCGLAFFVNPIFIYMIFSENTKKFGNYRFLLLFFALFNLTYSVVNVVVPLDIHNYRYCFFLFLKHGWFVEPSEFHFNLLVARCSLVAASYAILLIHFIYRYLAIHNSKFTREKFYQYMTFSVLVFAMYFGVWHAICYYPGRANVEIKKYIREDFRELYGSDSMYFNMLGALFNEGSEETTFQSWVAVILWSSLSTISIVMFLVLAVMTIKKLKKMAPNTSRKTSKFQVELLRALVVQTVIPIFISFSPCLLSWYSPMLGIQLGRGINNIEAMALGVFAFVDPVAIILCLPIFRNRIFRVCRGGSILKSAKSSTVQTN
ncbi:hypothetical protein GCK72_020729 [Caenorhabditis remanei]|uniref:Serpentine Receptor, class J n=1 Tax=Caenorhabditis remanei TaxID=31234 RepID=A0A6A5GIB3_CAERE|nr:hypothetical protein GCK72_020729 [Caenorhabditis remanei]KAF1754169.1 hypothetical protein GCK72_020729 [Caenorhabditis remanei]